MYQKLYSLLHTKQSEVDIITPIQQIGKPTLSKAKDITQWYTGHCLGELQDLKRKMTDKNRKGSYRTGQQSARLFKEQIWDIKVLNTWHKVVLWKVVLQGIGRENRDLDHHKVVDATRTIALVTCEGLSQGRCTKSGACRQDAQQRWAPRESKNAWASRFLVQHCH